MSEIREFCMVPPRSTHLSRVFHRHRRRMQQVGNKARTPHIDNIICAMKGTIYWLVLLELIIMLDVVDAFAPISNPCTLIPSQVVSSSSNTRDNKKRNHRKKGPNSVPNLLVPSQVVSSRFPSSLDLAATATTASAATNSSSTTATMALKDSRRSRRRKRPLKKKLAKKETRVFDEYPTTGNLPDPWYRAIPMEHLRQHPRFHGLQPTVTELSSLDDVSLFRQESWQWDALHAGRCTTSQAAAALGFLDPTPGQILNVPPSWRKGAHRAYQRLSQKPVLRTLEDMRQVLLTDSESTTSTTPEPIEEDLWEETGETTDEDNSSNVTFVAEYLYEPTAEEFKERRKYIKERSGGDYLTNGIRLIWGNTQEATSVLTALNYFAQTDPNVAFSIGDRPLGEVGVMSQYVPQLQLEMYCLGPQCQSAVMVRQTATQGAVLLRMMRDDEWIEEMLYFLHRFQKEYVEAQKAPRSDFFWQGAESSRYRRFVHRTIKVRDSVTFVARLPNEAVQRGSALAPFFLD
eukprot:scaffold1211_cov169-Amphora_coffeaeformis.AAC.23